MAKTASHCLAVLVTSVDDPFKERRRHFGRSKIRFLGINSEIVVERYCCRLVGFSKPHFCAVGQIGQRNKSPH